MRLDQYLAANYGDYSRSTWQKYIELGYVSVNGVVVTSTKTPVSDEDKVAYTIPATPNFSENSLPIIYEDDNVIVIDKPVGTLTHAKGALTDEFSVAEFVRGKTSYKADTNRPGIVHRLDRDTSGVIICAKNDETAKHLTKQFQDRKAKKTYYAVVVGHPKQESAIIDVPIGRNPAKPSQFRADPNGKSAQTTYQLIEARANESLIQLQPKTGRTHQLRVHMQHIGTPIKGDRVYGKEADRLYLHAAELEITLPSGTRKTFTSPMPAEFNT